jgi:hypothetical protein
MGQKWETEILEGHWIKLQRHSPRIVSLSKASRTALRYAVLDDQIVDETAAPRSCKSYGERERQLNLSLHCSSAMQHGARDAAARALVLCAMLPRGGKKVERTEGVLVEKNWVKSYCTIFCCYLIKFVQPWIN